MEHAGNHDHSSSVRLRSPTAERIFAEVPGVETSSAGVNPDADNPISGDQLEWADVVFVFDESQRRKLQRGFASSLRGKRVVNLAIADEYEFMDPELIHLLWQRVPRSVSVLSGVRPDADS
ncbi:MAG: hypothetical protein B7Z55_11240 [Planctomycetales bacterium 12-60-4]|nr:MAG: hypothetical protein B7Z55_11240 [Planctomycetales bacterium 12-60-4]